MLSNFVHLLLIFNHVLIWFFWVLSILLVLVELGWLAFHCIVFLSFLFVLVDFGLASDDSSRAFLAKFVSDFIQVLSNVLSIFPYLYDCRRFC